MQFADIFLQRPQQLFLLCIVVFTSTLTYLITSEIFRADTKRRLGICLYHLNDNVNPFPVHADPLKCKSDHHEAPQENQVVPPVKYSLGKHQQSNCTITNETVLILTPVQHLDVIMNRYFKNIQFLNYSHCMIRIVLGINKIDQMAVFKSLAIHIHHLKHKFQGLEIHALNFDSNDTFDARTKQIKSIQMLRRGRLAQIRNSLLFSALENEKYVLWLDSEIRELPRNIIQTLLSAQKDVVVPSCMHRKNAKVLEIYDRNSWRETQESQTFLKNQDSNFLMLEGYSSSMRKLLPDLEAEGDIVELDGVGTCCLMVKADLHRQGAIFPPYIYHNHIESEGFAKIAKEMGYRLYGMPRIKVIH